MTTPHDLADSDFVIFGGTGDLALRKLIPALYLRDRDRQLPARTRIIAVSRSGLDDVGYRDKVRASLPSFVKDSTALDVERFVSRLHHVSLDVDDEEAWNHLAGRLLADANAVRVFYLAVGPALFGPICRQLDQHGLVDAESRVVLEKPIGHDLASAQQQ